MFDTVVGGASRVANGTNLGNLAPGHAGEISVQINDELADLWTKQVECNLLRMYFCKNNTTQHYSIESSGLGLQERLNQPLCY
jgi:hypothetical protein